MRRALSLAAARALATSSPKSDRCQQVAGLHLTSTNPWQQITADLAWPWGASHNREASWQGGRASSSAAVPSAPSFGGGQRETLDVLARAQIQPLLRPQLTDDEHPLGEGYNAWPFNVRAYYVGKPLGFAFLIQCWPSGVLAKHARKAGKQDFSVPARLQPAGLELPQSPPAVQPEYLEGGDCCILHAPDPTPLRPL